GASINGQTFGIFRLRDPMRAAITLRKDWLDALGLDEPETTSDLQEIARAFSEEDPAGDGAAPPGWSSPPGKGTATTVPTTCGRPGRAPRTCGRTVTATSARPS